MIVLSIIKFDVALVVYDRGDDDFIHRKGINFGILLQNQKLVWVSSNV